MDEQNKSADTAQEVAGQPARRGWRILGKRPNKTPRQKRKKSKDKKNAANPRYPWLWRSRWRRWLARGLAWGTLGVAALALAAYGLVKILVKPADLQALIKEQVETQTGGKLEIGGLSFDVLTGLQLRGLRFYPPRNGDKRGFIHGGDVESEPLATLEALDIKYSIPKILAGRLHLKALRLVRPELHLKQSDGVFSFAGIMAYREVQFPPKPDAALKPTTAPVATEATPSGALLPFSPSLLYLPFELLAQNVGIKDLRFDLQTIKGGKVVQDMEVRGLNLDLGVHWQGRDSSLWLSSLSPFEAPFVFRIMKPASGQGAKPAVNVEAAMNLRFELNNFQKINFDLATRLTELATPVAGYKDIGAFAKLRLAATDDMRGIDLGGLSVTVADAVNYELNGKVSVGDARLETINLQLAQSLGLDLQRAAALAKPFLPELSASGQINLSDLKVEGILDLKKLATVASTGSGLPQIAGMLWLEDVMVDLPSTGVRMQPLSGSVSLAVGEAMGDSGAQIDVGVDLDIPAVEAKQTLPTIGAITAGVSDLSAKVTTRLLWPQLVAPVFKVDIEAEHVKAHGDHITTVDVPLYVNIDAEGGKDLSRLGLSTNFELTNLVELALMADCQSGCERFRANASLRLEALERLHAMALPIASLVGAGGVMPTKLNGAVDFQLNARGKLPSPQKTPLADLVKAADVQLNSQLNIVKVNAKLPLFGVDLRNFETRVLINGNLAEQKLDISNKFESLALALPKAGGKPTPVTIERLAFESAIANNIAGAIDLTPPLDTKKFLDQLRTAFDTRLYVGKVTGDGLLPRPMAEIQLGVKASQAHGHDIKLEDLALRVPDYGTVVNVNADTMIGPDFLPRSLRTEAKIQVVHTGEEKLPAGIKTNGRLDLRVAVATADLRHVSLDGEVGFDKFNVTIPAKDGQGPPLLQVQDMQGQLPFKQQVVIPDVLHAKAAGTALATANGADKTEASDTKNAQDIPEVPMHPEDLAGGGVKAANAGTGNTANSGSGEGLTSEVDKYFEKNSDQLAANTNVVALVDYGTIRPFYPERRPLAIKRVEAANLELSNMEFDLELRQNWFALNQFVIGFLGGKIQGDFQLAFDPQASDPRQILRRLRTSLHLTRLDTRKLIERFPNLAGKASTWDPFANPFIDGTVHLQFDVKSNDIGGGVEITSIGKEQLKMMLYYVDPYEQNATISDIRKALAVGEVSHVSIPLKNGEVGMDVDIRLLGAPFPTPKLSHFPISQILQNFKDKAGSSGQTPAAPTTPATQDTPTKAPGNQQAFSG